MKSSYLIDIIDLTNEPNIIEKQFLNNMQETIQLIDKALVKANNDLNNESIEVNYTPEFLIELLTELKESLKPKDFYEIKVEWSDVFMKNRLYIYRNNSFLFAYDTLEEAEKSLNFLKERKEVSNESAN
jgi:hypothetical protein